MHPGQKLRHYEIVEKLGAGGMGEVYRGKDAKLGRDVAIKILPEEFTRDADRRARFEREARVLASLNHPGIATLHDIQEAGDHLFLVMELVEGETLAERIRREPLPLDEAVEGFVQIADALEVAHDKGIIHRDLKPANVKITPDGRIKLLDFGLAKAFAADEREPLESSLSPTLTKGTALGTILGTASYMSPEQARGKTVDARTDIWSFGCCLYEAVTGKKLFDGETVTDILAAVVKTEPDLSQAPASLRRLLRRCLTKDLRRRMKDIADARLELQEPAEAAVEPTPSRRAGSIIPWIVAAASFAAAIVLFVSRPQRTAPPVRKFQVELPDSLRRAGAPAGAISPDGERIVLVAVDASGRRALWLRSLDSLEVQKLVGTAGASFPFWAPDSRRIGFFAENELRVVDLTGAPPRKLCDVPVPSGRGGTWNGDGVILFAAGNTGLTRVADTGGPVEVVTELDRKRQENSHRWPWFLPDGEHFLFTARSDVGEHSIAVGSLTGGEPVRLLNAFSTVAYSEGYLLYARGETLTAQRFDADALELEGDPIPVATGIGGGELMGFAAFSVAANGALIYASGSSHRRLAWLDVQGKEREGPSLDGVIDPATVRLSPDGSNAALVLPDIELGSTDIWSYDLSRGVSERLTFDPGWEQYPVWSPDGRRIAYRTDGDAAIRILDVDAPGTTPKKVISGEHATPTDWSPDGRFLIYEKEADLFALPIEEEEPIPLADSPFDEGGGRISPDGRLLAYVSNETGGEEIWLKPFLANGRRERVSKEGGSSPLWSPRGETLFYLNPELEAVAVPIRHRSPYTLGPPKVLFRVSVAEPNRSWEILPDDKGFLVIVSSESRPDWTVVFNWAAEIHR